MESIAMTIAEMAAKYCEQNNKTNSKEIKYNAELAKKISEMETQRN